MIPHHKNKALVGVPVGLLLFGGSLFLSFQELTSVWPRIVMFLGGIGIYIWGCLALAEAKGYSTAIVLTAILGVLFPIPGVLLPVVVLLALPDKHKRYRR